MENMETVTVGELDLVTGEALSRDDNFLVEVANEKVVKRVSFEGLMSQERTARTASDEALLSQINDINNTFTEFVLVSAVPTVQNMQRHVLYLYNVTGDIYQGYYLIETTSGNHVGQLGGRSYTGINGITINFSEGTISNDLVTDGGTINGDLEVKGNAEFEKNVEISKDLMINGNIYQRGENYETHAEKLFTKKNLIITRDGAQSPLTVGEYTGLKAKHYNNNGDDGVLAFDKTGTARVGDYIENQESTVYSPDGISFYRSKTSIAVYSKDGSSFFRTKQSINVYSENGSDFYNDSELTNPISIPSGVTPVAQSEANLYSYDILSNPISPLVQPILTNGIDYLCEDFSNQITIPAGITPTATENAYEYKFEATIDNTQPLLTRDEEFNLQNNSLLSWDSTNKKAKGIATPEQNKYLKFGTDSYEFSNLPIERGSVSDNQIAVYNKGKINTVPAPSSTDPSVLVNTNGVYSYSSDYIKKGASVSNNRIPIYDNGHIDTMPAPTINGQVLTATVNGQTITYTWSSSSGGGGTFYFATMADFDLAKVIPEGQTGYVPNNSTIVIGEIDNNLIGEDA